MPAALKVAVVCGAALLPNVTVPGPLATCQTVARVAPGTVVYVTVPERLTVAPWLTVWLAPAEATGGAVGVEVPAGFTVTVTVPLLAKVPSVADRLRTRCRPR